jgi:hypothetical protein
MSRRVPIGVRIYRHTHQRINRIARELGVTNGEVIDQAIARLPVLQCEMPLGPPAPHQIVRTHVRRVRPQPPAEEL